jgi:hypothetical protein
VAKGRKTRGRGIKRSITISIDLGALDKLYRKRYEVSLDGDTKGGSVKIRDGDTKRGMQIRDGDTRGGRRPVKRRRAKKSPSKP